VNLSEPFIRRPIATSLLMAAVAFTGVAAFPFLPVASLPQIDFPTIQVTATLAGASAETVASSVAAPLERQFAQISGITQMTSVSTLGATQVAIQFDLNKSIDSAAQDVQAAISIANKTLPQSMTIPPNYRKINPADPPILVLGARSETLPLTSINDYLDRFLAQQISQVPGVAQAGIGGIGGPPSASRSIRPSWPRSASPSKRYARLSSLPPPMRPRARSIRTRSVLSLRPMTRLPTQTRSMMSC
jgi:multidrug efflux pump subunit AcrB